MDTTAVCNASSVNPTFFLCQDLVGFGLLDFYPLDKDSLRVSATAFESVFACFFHVISAPLAMFKYLSAKTPPYDLPV